MSTLSDTELVALLREGNDKSFAEIYKRYWKKCLHFATQKTGDFMEGENIVQDVFVSLWNRRSGFQITSNLSNYLIVSVKYRVLTLLDKQRSQRIYKEVELLNADILDDSTQNYLDFQELQHRLEELIGTLPEKSALIFRMNKEDGMSHREIATELGMSEKAINAQLVRTKKTLRTALNTFLHTLLL
jgi:RNA polymerase sigma-70 factor (family 1)